MSYKKFRNNKQKNKSSGAGLFILVLLLIIPFYNYIFIISITILLLLIAYIVIKKIKQKRKPKIRKRIKTISNENKNDILEIKTKSYYKTKTPINEFEMKIYQELINSSKDEYIILPQVNLRSIIDTDTLNKHYELNRNIDIGVFTKQYKPILMIEINGMQHYTDINNIKRDKSVKNILNKVNIPLITIDVTDIKKMDDTILKEIVNEILFQLNQNKIDNTWINLYIKERLKNIKGS